MQQTVLPIAPDLFWTLAGFVGLLVAAWVIVVILPKRSDDNTTPVDRVCDTLGLPRQFGIVVVLLGVFALVLIPAAFFVAWDFVKAGLHIAPYAQDTKAEAIRNIGLVLAALVGAPFVVWRTYVAAKQARIQDDALFNDKINAAAEGLAARRQVTHVVGARAARKVLTEWEDDLVTRAAAIDRLEGLARERREVTPRIARQLSIYVRELSREYPPEEPPENATPDELRKWASGLKVKRPDMEKAAQSLGRLRAIENHGLAHGDIDMRGANLQAFDLQRLDFQEALLSEASLQGADLSVAKMQGAELIGAEMQGANLYRAEMQGAVLSGAEMDEITKLTAATLRGAAVSLVDDTTIAQLKPFWNDIFADGSVQLPEGEQRPAHWEDDELEALEFLEKWKAWRATLS